jgi:hypothetical protein
VILGGLLFVVFHESPVLRVSDSLYSMLVSEQLLLNRSFELDEYFRPNVGSARYRRGERWRRLPRQVHPIGDHLYYWYPPGTPLLSVPLAGALRLAGLSTIGDDGRYVPSSELRMQRISAALLMALAGVVFFAMARRRLPIGWSLFVALVGSLGTHVWSIASRSLQGHCWLVLLMAVALHELLRAESDRRRLRPVWLGGILSLAFWVRPTAPLLILPITAYVWLRHRRSVWSLLLTGTVGLALFLAYSRSHFGQWLPDYYLGGQLATKHLLYGLSASLVSPSRGIVVYSSFLVLVAYALVAYRRHLPHPGLATTAVVAIVLHVFVVALQPITGAQGYGPRFLTDLVPFFVLLSILAARAALDAPSPWRWRRRLELATLAATVALSVLIHGAGALSQAGRDWNRRPVPLREQPMRVFDWRRPQWLCALFPHLLPPKRGPQAPRRAR